jgi:superfamily II DNA/RNA helicase
MEEAEPCRAFMEGKCHQGDNCRFFHGSTSFQVRTIAPVDSPMPEQAPPAKTIRVELCRNFQAGKCRKGNKCNFLHGQMETKVPAAPTNNTTPQAASNSGKSFMTETTFNSLNISALSKKGIIETMGYTHMTSVQAQALPAVLTGQDVLGQAKTGTGKTLAFLIPAVEKLLQGPLSPGQFGILVLSPTRELASQIATEAKRLTTFHTKLKVKFFVGGNNKNTEAKSAKDGAAVLVATPGRLLDHMNNTPDFADRFRNLRLLILDEADQLSPDTLED